MGVSAARIRLLIDSRDKREALLLYYAQLFVNILWSFFFFTFQAYLFSFVWLLLLWFLIFAMLRALLTSHARRYPKMQAIDCAKLILDKI